MLLALIKVLIVVYRDGVLFFQSLKEELSKSRGIKEVSSRGVEKARAVYPPGERKTDRLQA